MFKEIVVEQRFQSARDLAFHSEALGAASSPTALPGSIEPMPIPVP